MISKKKFYYIVMMCFSTGTLVGLMLSELFNNKGNFGIGLAATCMMAYSQIRLIFLERG